MARYAVALGAIALVALTTVDPSPAGDLGDEAFGLRLGLALDRASTFTDVTALSASTAYPYLSSVNPAAGDFLREPPNQFRVIGTLTGAYVAFNNGSSIIAGAASATYRLPSAGTILASYTRVDSQDVESHQGDHFTLRSNELRLTYSHLLDTWIAVGGAVRLSQSRLGFSSLFSDFPLHTGNRIPRRRRQPRGPGGPPPALADRSSGGSGVDSWRDDRIHRLPSGAVRSRPHVH